MNIQEALKTAGKNGKIVRCRDLIFDPIHYLSATDDPSRVLMYTHSKNIPTKIEPRFDDILADDWVVVKGTPDTKKNPY